MMDPLESLTKLRAYHVFVGCASSCLLQSRFGDVSSPWNVHSVTFVEGTRSAVAGVVEWIVAVAILIRGGRGYELW